MRNVLSGLRGAAARGVAIATVLILTATALTGASAAGPVTIWGTSTPTGAVDTDKSAVELGTRFTAITTGQATAVRYYKTPENTGTHTGSLWTNTGTLLGRTTFTNETTTGWQTATFTTPITLTAGTTYVVSYHTNTGRYYATGNYHGTSTNPTYLTVPTTNAGVYTYATNPTVPKNTWNSSQYWVDLTFTPGTTPTTTTTTTSTTPKPTTTTTTRTPTPTPTSTTTTRTPTPTTPTATLPSRRPSARNTPSAACCWSRTSRSTARWHWTCSPTASTRSTWPATAPKPSSSPPARPTTSS